MTKDLLAFILEVSNLSVCMHAEDLWQIDVGQAVDVILNLLCSLMNRAVVMAAI